ncbi:MAG: hypothetical protein ACLQOO_35875, partial [Terriglobia bacterium]
GMIRIARAGKMPALPGFVQTFEVVLTEQSEECVENKGRAPKNKPETKRRTAGAKGIGIPAASGRRKAEGRRQGKAMAERL